MRQVGVTCYLANVTHGNDPVSPITNVEIKVGDEKADPILFEGEKTKYGFEDGTEVVQLEILSAEASENKIVMDVDSSKECLAIDFALEFGLLDNIYVWTVTGTGDAVLVAEISCNGGLISGDGVVVIKDSQGNEVTSEVLGSLEMEKYTLYVYYNGADEVHIGCADVGNYIYWANATYEV